MNFYCLIADPAASSRWFLRSPIDADDQEIDPRSFTSGARRDVAGLLRIPLRRDGTRVAFNFCDFDMIVSLASLNARLQTIAGGSIQRIPVTVGDETSQQFEILNICDAVHCFDEARSEFTKWIPADGRPEKTGGLRMVARLRIDPVPAGGHEIFRVAEWPIAVIVSEKVRTLLESVESSGVTCQSVA